MHDFIQYGAIAGTVGGQTIVKVVHSQVDVNFAVLCFAERIIYRCGNSGGHFVHAVIINVVDALPDVAQEGTLDSAV